MTKVALIHKVLGENTKNPSSQKKGREVIYSRGTTLVDREIPYPLKNQFVT